MLTDCIHTIILLHGLADGKVFPYSRMFLQRNMVPFNLRAYICPFVSYYHRLEMGDFQLITDIENKPGHTEKGSRGLRLPDDFSPEHLSILSETCGGKSKDRAVISLAGVRHGTAHHSIVQLQVCEGDGNDTVDRILAYNVAKGAIPVGSSPSDHVFLASCSFQFDLIGVQG